MTTIKKIYVTIAIFGILSIFLIGFCLYLFKEIKKNSQELSLENEKMVLLTQEKEELKKFQEFYKTYQSDFNKFENLFVEAETPIEFIEFLEEIASSSQVQLEILSMANFTSQLSLSSSFPNFLRFLEKIENSPYLIEFLNLEIRKLSKREIRPEKTLTNVQALLSIKVFSK